MYVNIIYLALWFIIGFSIGQIIIVKFNDSKKDTQQTKYIQILESTLLVKYKLINNRRQVVRDSILSIDEVNRVFKNYVLKNLDTPSDTDVKFFNIKNKQVKMLSERFKCFYNSGFKCISCGTKIEYFVLEAHKNMKLNGGVSKIYHINAYTIKNSKEILMTKDHIKPKSKGGLDHYTNYQTMCQQCNTLKSDSY